MNFFKVEKYYVLMINLAIYFSKRIKNVKCDKKTTDYTSSGEYVYYVSNIQTKTAIKI